MNAPKGYIHAGVGRCRVAARAGGLTPRANLRCLGLSALIAIAGCNDAAAQGRWAENVSTQSIVGIDKPAEIHIRFTGAKGWVYEGTLERGVKMGSCGGSGVISKVAQVGEYGGCVLVVDWPERAESAQ
jgi:hypothetical protein